MDGIRAERSPIAGLRARGVVWVRPELRAEIAYRGWTHDRLLRAASFRALLDRE